MVDVAQVRASQLSVGEGGGEEKSCRNKVTFTQLHRVLYVGRLNAIQWETIWEPSLSQLDWCGVKFCDWPPVPAGPMRTPLACSQEVLWLVSYAPGATTARGHGPKMLWLVSDLLAVTIETDGHDARECVGEGWGDRMPSWWGWTRVISLSSYSN